MGFDNLSASVCDWLELYACVASPARFNVHSFLVTDKSVSLQLFHDNKVKIFVDLVIHRLGLFVVPLTFTANIEVERIPIFDT